MSVTSLEMPRPQPRSKEIPIRTILDPRFPQPGRYSEFGVPEVPRPAADLLYRALIDCPERSLDAQVVESGLLKAAGTLVEGVIQFLAQDPSSVLAASQHRAF
ncbi:MAG: hypothetical protein ACP5XB_10730 [Isosphaeraceae bacterium]